MKTTNPVDAARIELVLSDLRLPATKSMWAKLVEQSDKDGWPAARFLAALAEHEIADRGRRRTREGTGLVGTAGHAKGRGLDDRSHLGPCTETVRRDRGRARLRTEHFQWRACRRARRGDRQGLTLVASARRNGTGFSSWAPT